MSATFGEFAPRRCSSDDHIADVTVPGFDGNDRETYRREGFTRIKCKVRRPPSRGRDAKDERPGTAEPGEPLKRLSWPAGSDEVDFLFVMAYALEVWGKGGRRERERERASGQCRADAEEEPRHKWAGWLADRPRTLALSPARPPAQSAGQRSVGALPALVPVSLPLYLY